MITTKEREYEVLVVFNPNTQDEVVHERTNKIEEVAKAHEGTITKNEMWGRRSLAYPINNYKYGLFLALNIKANGTFVSDLNRQLHLMDEVLRSFVVTKNKYSPDLDGRLKSDFTYGYRPPQSQFGAKSFGIADDDDVPVEDIDSMDAVL